MKESVGYTVSLNIMIIFITIIVAFLSAALIYFKSNKVSNIITDSIEKYEGYNSLSQNEITMKLSSLGYNVNQINCQTTVASSTECKKVASVDGSKGYCIYYCDEGDYYYYKIRTNMMFNIPIVNDILNIPIFSNTNRLYDFQNNLGD